MLSGRPLREQICQAGIGTEVPGIVPFGLFKSGTVAVDSLHGGGIGDTVIIWSYADDFSCKSDVIRVWFDRNSLDILTTCLVEFDIGMVEVTSFHLP